MIRAVERALAIFDAFDREHQSLTLQEIGDRIGMPKATTFRLVNTLHNSGFLVRLEGQRYSLSLKVVRLAGLVRSTISVREIARPTMAEVSERTGETVTLNARLGRERICIDVVETPAPLMTIVKPGEHVSLLFGATARLLLAYMGEAEIDAVVAADAPSGFDPEALKAQLAAYRRDGYAHTSNQRIQGVTAVAVPLFDVEEQVHHTLAITGPSVRMDPGIDGLIGVMQDAGQRISALLGSSGGKAGAQRAPSRQATLPPVNPASASVDRAATPASVKTGA